MIFYKRMIGDIQAKTGALSCAEMGIYDRFLDHYYSLEEPIPADFDDCCRIARAMTKEERKGVEKVLGKFFTLTERGYEQGKAEEMLADARPKIEAARTNGLKGGRPKKPKLETQKEPTGFFEETQMEPNGKASQSQSQREGIGNPDFVAEEIHPFNTHTGRVGPGEICKALKAIGIGDVNPGHADLLMLLEAGAEQAEFEGAARTAVGKSKGFAYALGIVKRSREDAAKTLQNVHQGAMPATAPPQSMSFAERDRIAGMQRWEKQCNRKHPDLPDEFSSFSAHSGAIEMDTKTLSIAQ